MQQRSKLTTGKLTTIIILSLTLLILSSCSGGSGKEPQDALNSLKEAQSGTQGVETRIVPNFLPSTLFDRQQLSLMVEVKNKGAHDVEAQDCFVHITGFDHNIIPGGLNVPRSCGDNYGTLEGKDIYNLDGSFNQLAIESSTIGLPLGVNEYSPNLVIDTCYRYITTATATVCIDPKNYNFETSQQSCRSGSVSLGGGQGGPVGVGYVGVTMAGQRATFDINIQSYGTGTVLSNAADIQNCGFNNWNFNELNHIIYSVRFGNGQPLDCKPRDGTVRLAGTSGKIICTTEVPNGAAYETPLVIDLSYGYKNSITQGIRIVRTPE